MFELPDFSKPPPNFFPTNQITNDRRLPPPNFNVRFQSFLPPPPSFLPQPQQPMVRSNLPPIHNQSWNNSHHFSHAQPSGFIPPHTNGQTPYINNYHLGQQGSTNDNFPHSQFSNQGPVNNSFPHSVVKPQFSNQNRRGFHSSYGGRHSGQPRNGQQYKVRTENNAFFCDICDKGFKNQELYKKHTDGHIKCSFEGCPYVAAPKLVQLHKSLQHKSGMAKKVWSLESAEDVRKWREERKKNFPTQENVEKKKKELADRISRGERIHTKNFSKFDRDRHGGRGRRGGRDNRRGWGWRNRGRQGMEDGSGEQQQEDDDNDDGPPEEVKIVKEVNRPDTEATLQPSLTEASTEIFNGLGLLASYGDSSSDTENKDDGTKLEEGPVADETSHFDADKSSNEPESTLPLSVTSGVKADENSPCPSTTSGQLMVNDNKSNVMASSTRTDKANDNKRCSEGRKRGLEHNNSNNHRYKRKRMQHNYTLLEKLLATDIRRERNKILQCVHYIVQQHFFDNNITPA